MLEVRQEDREASARLYQDYLSRSGEVPVAAAMRVGHIDESPLIQAFARHRLNATADQSAEIARLRAALEDCRHALAEARGALLIYDGQVTDPKSDEGWTDPDGYSAYMDATMACRAAATALNTKDADR